MHIKFKSLISNRNYSKLNRKVETGAAGGVRERKVIECFTACQREKGENVLFF